MSSVVNRYIRWIVGLSATGTLLSLYSLLHKEGFTSGAICNLSDTFNCDVVNQGPYSEIFGIPVAFIGVLGYLFLLIAAMVKMKHPEDRGASVFLLGASVGGFVFALYLSGLEAFVLHVWCLVCLTSQVLIASLAVFSLLNYRSDQV